MWVGLEVGKADHHALMTDSGGRLSQPAIVGREYAIPVELLRRVPLFHQLDLGELEAVARLFKLSRFGTGETVTKEGSRGAAFYLIHSGTAKVSVKGSRARRAPHAAGDHGTSSRSCGRTPRSHGAAAVLGRAAADRPGGPAPRLRPAPGQQQSSPSQASIPSRTASAAIPSATTGSSHQACRVALASRPISTPAAM